MVGDEHTDPQGVARDGATSRPGGQDLPALGWAALACAALAGDCFH